MYFSKCTVLCMGHRIRNVATENIRYIRSRWYALAITLTPVHLSYPSLNATCHCTCKQREEKEDCFLYP
jgi:hypothetical protein